jgi:hypothetical protein
VNPPRALKFIARTLAALAALSLALPAHAQQPPTLEEVLERLEANLNRYENGVPSFFCEEHVVSEVNPSNFNGHVVTDSTFRLKRVLHATTISLDESRDIKTINHRPAAEGQQIGGPAILSGAFSGGLAIVSTGQQACMNYKLKLSKRRNAPYVVEFTSAARAEYPPECLLHEEGSGRVLIDPATMQIKRIELKAPHHTLRFPPAPDGSASAPVVGLWNVSVNYAPVPLGGQTFWMPSTIASSLSAVTGESASGPVLSSRGSRGAGLATLSPVTTTWEYEARYSDYHKLEVTSRIVAVEGAPAP